MPTKPKTKRVKAWMHIYDGEIVSYTSGIKIFLHKKSAVEETYGADYNYEGYKYIKIIPATITYTLPATKKK